MAVLKNIKRETPGVPAPSRGIHENIERSLGFNRNIKPNRGKPFYHLLPSSVKLTHHCLASPAPLHFLNGGDSRFLNKRSGGNKEILLKFLHVPYEVLRNYHVTETPTRHGVELGEAVYRYGVVGEFQNGVNARAIDKTVVDLV